RRMIGEGHREVKGAPGGGAIKLRRGEEVAWQVPPRLPSTIDPESIPLAIVYEDEDLVVINKPKGLVVHPAPGNWSGTLVNALLGRYGTRLSEAGGVERPGIVHRLDRDTSGLLVVARNDRTYRSLQRQIQNRTAERRYLALLRANPGGETAVVDAPIGRDPRDRKRMAVIGAANASPDAGGPAAQPAQTDLRVLERFPGFALLEARLQSGRTH